MHMHTLKLSAPVASEVVGARATAIWMEKASPAAGVPEVRPTGLSSQGAYSTTPA